MSFQTQVYVNPAQGQPGDFASSNPVFSQMSSTGKMVADVNGVTVGKFASINADGTVSSIPASAPNATQIGFVHREANAQIVTYLADTSLTIYQGEPVALFAKGDFFASADVVASGAGRGTPILWDTATGHTNVGGTASATLLETGYVYAGDTLPVVGQTILISTSIA